MGARGGMKELAAVESVSKSYGRHRVLSSVSLTVRPGRVHALMGRNGSGKTTLLQIACGVERADHGFVRYGGRVMERPRLHRLARRGLWFLPHEGLLTGSWTVGAHLRRVGAGRPVRAARELGIEGLLERSPDQLSGGERRRVELALVQVRKPDCLLADEPFRGLAPVAAREVGRRLRRLAARGCGVLVTGHEVPDVLDIADEVSWLRGGRVRHLGTPSAARSVAGFRERYLAS